MGPSDRATLDRLRAIALLLHAARSACPVLGQIDISLETNRDFLIHTLDSNSMDALLLIAQAGGWWDLLDPFSDRLGAPDFPQIPHLPSPPAAQPVGTPPDRATSASFLSLFVGITQRLAALEFPDGCATGLGAVLHHICCGTALSEASTAFLAQAGWEIFYREKVIRPSLPVQPSAHEILDALTVVAAPSAPSSPLSVLAHAAAALSGDTP